MIHDQRVKRITIISCCGTIEHFVMIFKFFFISKQKKNILSWFLWTHARLWKSADSKFFSHVRLIFHTNNNPAPRSFSLRVGENPSGRLKTKGVVLLSQDASFSAMVTSWWKFIRVGLWNIMLERDVRRARFKFTKSILWVSWRRRNAVSLAGHEFFSQL